MGEQVGQIYYSVTLDTSKMIDGQRAITREVGKAASTFNLITNAVKLYAAALTALKLLELADQFRLLAARVEVAAGSIESGAAAMDELVAISRRTQTSLTASIDVFARLNQSILQMGGTQRDTLGLTELLAKAIKVSGASATEAKSAMLQFGQAIGSGKLAGDELRSLLENAPYLMRQLADGIGVPIGALKGLGEQGKLTADVVVNALGKAAAKIDADFKKFPQTIESAMVVAQDNAGRAALKFDELSGSSAALTGITKGLGDVLDKLADQFGAANTEAGKLGRNAAVKTWADEARNAFSYLVDVVDVVWQTLSVLGRNVAFVFKGIGTEIGGLAAQAVAVAKFDFSGAAAIGEAMKADAEQRRKELDESDAKTLAKRKLFGEQMREAWESGAGGGRGFVNPTPPASKLKATPDAEEAKKLAARRLAAQAYYEGLVADNLNAIEKIDAEEAKALTENKKRMVEDKANADIYAKAKLEIEKNYAQQRQDVELHFAEERRQSIEDAGKLEREQKQQSIEYAAQLTKAINPVDALRQEYQAKLDLVTQYEQLMAQAGVDATQQGTIARTQIEREYQLQRTALAEQSFRSQSDANAFLIDSINALSTSAAGAIAGLIQGTMTASDVMRALGNVVLNEAVKSLVQLGVQQIKNAVLGDTIAAADAARKVAVGAVYAASVTAQVAGMSALAAQNAFAATAAIPIIGPALAPAAAAAAGAAAAAIGAPAIATAPIAGARQYGGGTSAGSLYRVNEGGRPEMWTAANGSQYMMPTKDGSVTPADHVGGGVAWTINVHNAPPGTSATVDEQSRVIDIAVARAEANVVDSIANRTGPVWSTLRGTTNVQGRN